MLVQGMPVVAVDAGNVNLKFKYWDFQNGRWTVKVDPSLYSIDNGYRAFQMGSDPSLTDASSLRYLSGPAADVVGDSSYFAGIAARYLGVTQTRLVGNAGARISHPLFPVLHLYALARSLPDHMTTADVILIVGLPVNDYAIDSVRKKVRLILTGSSDTHGPSVPHVFRWNKEYRVTVKRLLIAPQPVGALAAMLLTEEGKLAPTALDRPDALWYVLDIGGGTTDFIARQGLHPVPGADGGVMAGVYDVATLAAAMIKKRVPSLSYLTPEDVLNLMDPGMHPAQSDAARAHVSPSFRVNGADVDVSDDISRAVESVGSKIIGDVLSHWQRNSVLLSASNVVIAGGGGDMMREVIARHIPGAHVTLVRNPVTAIVDGLHRLALFKTQAS